MATRRSFLLDQHAIDDLVPAVLLRDRQQVSDGRRTPPRRFAHVVIVHGSEGARASVWAPANDDIRTRVRTDAGHGRDIYAAS
jgi:hypothetical protein